MDCQRCVEICEQEVIRVEEIGVEMSDTCAALLRDITLTYVERFNVYSSRLKGTNCHISNRNNEDFKGEEK